MLSSSACIVVLGFCWTQAIVAQDLVWADEFDVLNRSIWDFNVGAGGWGNQELQEYKTDNVRVEDGKLIITAQEESDGTLTSGRIISYVGFQYGKIEASIKLPGISDGLWPAFWMIGSNFEEVGWPGSGSVAIMQAGSARSREQGFSLENRVGSSVFWEGDNGQTISDFNEISTLHDLTSNFLTYQLEWTPDSITTFVEGVEIFTQDISSCQCEELHQPFFFILNMAVGGTYTRIYERDDVTAPLPAEFVVDYIRVYENGYTVVRGSSQSAMNETSSAPSYLADDGAEATPTPRPTVLEATMMPTVSPSPGPTSSSTTTAPTESPTPEPTSQPTRSPKTPEPTQPPTMLPTTAPPTPEPTTLAPTKSPTRPPSVAPTRQPTTPEPTESPTDSPTLPKSPAPSVVVGATFMPSDELTPVPTDKETTEPTWSDTNQPTESPTVSPTSSPTEAPTVAPLQRLKAVGSTMTLQNIAPLDSVRTLKWQRVTREHLSAEIPSMLIGAELVDVLVTLTSQNPPYVASRHLNEERRLQTMQELTFDTVVTIKSGKEGHAVNTFVEKSFERDSQKQAYLEKLKASDDGFANAAQLSMTQGASSSQIQSGAAADDRGGVDTSGIPFIVGISVASVAVAGLLSLFVYSRRKARTPSRAATAVETTGGSQREMHPFAASKEADEDSLYDITLQVPNTSIPRDGESVFTTGSSVTMEYDDQVAFQQESVYASAETSVAAGGATESYMRDPSAQFYRFTVEAPPGLLGMVLETSVDGFPIVYGIKNSSPLAGAVHVGDRLMTVDGIDVSEMDCTAVSRLIASKKKNTFRQFVFVRPQSDGVDPDDEDQ